MEKQPQVSVQGTTLEVLAPYLPYGIEVEVRYAEDDIERGSLVLLPSSGRYVHVQHDDPRSEDGKVTTMVTLATCLPILRPFSQLCEPLEDGTVPAVEVAKMLTNGEPGEYTFEISQHEYINGVTVLCYIDGELVYQLDLVPGWDWWLSDLLATANHEEITVKAPAKVVDYLRSKHFAVGLEPAQFIAKPAAASPTKEQKPGAGEGDSDAS